MHAPHRCPCCTGGAPESMQLQRPIPLSPPQRSPSHSTACRHAHAHSRRNWLLAPEWVGLGGGEGEQSSIAGTGTGFCRFHGGAVCRGYLTNRVVGRLASLAGAGDQKAQSGRPGRGMGFESTRALATEAAACEGIRRCRGHTPCDLESFGCRLPVLSQGGSDQSATAHPHLPGAPVRRPAQ